MKIWLDDLREMPPKGYDIHVRTYREAIDLISQGTVTRISFDHDLGHGKTGYDVAKFIETAAFEDVIPPMEWSIHSSNPVGRNNIIAAMTNAMQFWMHHGKIKRSI